MEAIKPFIESCLKIIESALKPIYAELEMFAINENSQELNLKGLKQKFQRLALLLRNFDIGAKRSLAAIVSKIPSTVRCLPSLNTLQNKVSHYEYENAISTLD